MLISQTVKKIIMHLKKKKLEKEYKAMQVSFRKNSDARARRSLKMSADLAKIEKNSIDISFFE